MYQAQAQQNKYRETAIQTAAPAQLLIMLMDGAIRFCKQGIQSIRENKPEEANRNLSRVQDIISELVITLDHKAPIAEGLIKLYDYFVHRLIEANMKKDPQPAEEVLEFLVELKEVWTEAALKAKAASQTAAAQTPVAGQDTAKAARNG